LKPLANLDQLELSLESSLRKGKPDDRQDDSGDHRRTDDIPSVGLLFRFVRKTGAAISGLQLKKHDYRSRSYAIMLNGKADKTTFNLWLTINVNVMECEWMKQAIDCVVMDDLLLKSKVIRGGFARSLFYYSFNNTPPHLRRNDGVLFFASFLLR
jgi:hypothetical protein